MLARVSCRQTRPMTPIYMLFFTTFLTRIVIAKLSLFFFLNIATIETATEIYVVLKTDDERFMPVEEMQLHWAHQKAFVSFLARHMNLGTRRRLHLFMNQQSIVHGQLLGVPTKHAGAAASSIACKAQEILGNSDRMKNYSPQDEATVLDALQLQLSNETEIGALLETHEGHGNLRPARIVVWLAHGSEQRSPKSVIKTAVERLKQNFKGNEAILHVFLFVIYYVIFHYLHKNNHT